MRAMYRMTGICRMCSAKDNADEKWAWAFHAACRAPFLFGVVAFLAPYLTSTAKFSMNEDGKVTWIVPMNPTSYFAVASTIALILGAVVSPHLGALTDFTDHRKLGLVVSNTVGAFSAVLLILVTQDLWWLGGILYIVAYFAYSCMILFIYAYLPEVSESHRVRSRVSASSLAFANCFQVLFAILLTVFLLFASSPQMELSNPDFEDTDVSAWQVSYFNTTSIQASQRFCPFDIMDSGGAVAKCQRVREEASRGRYSLRVETPAGGTLSQTSDQKPSVYQGNDLLFELKLKIATAAASPFALNISDSAALLGSRPFTASKSYPSTSRFVIAPVPDDSQGLNVAASWSSGGVYFVDDAQAFTRFDRMRLVAMCLLGIWWFVASIFVFRNFDPRPAAKERLAGRGLFGSAHVQVVETLRTAYKPEHRNAYLFLIAAMFYATGSSGVIAVVGPFLSEQLRFSPAVLGVILLFAQLTGILGAFIFHKVGKRAGLKRSLVAVWCMWVVVPVLAGVLLQDETDRLLAWPIAALTGLSLGGAVAGTRAMYASFIPPGQAAELMGLYNFYTQISAWVGPLTFAVINELTDNINVAVSCLSGYLLIGTILLLFVKYTPPALEHSSSTVQMQKLDSKEELVDEADEVRSNDAPASDMAEDNGADPKPPKRVYTWAVPGGAGAV